MTLVTRGLVIDGNWVSLILAGRKTWEMRSQAAKIRGTIGLIRKGTGLVCGVVDLVDCLPALSTEEMIANAAKHQIPEHMISDGEVDKWRIPWVLENPISFLTPVPYDHPNGAVKWVTFAEHVSSQIAKRLDNVDTDEVLDSEPRSRRPASAQAEARPLSDVLAPLVVDRKPQSVTRPEAAPGVMIGRTVITEGNLKNNHIYLRGFFDKFPKDAVGGSNRQSSGKATVHVRWSGSKWHETDLDGQKQFFRSRSLVREFLADTGAEGGDLVEVEQLAPYRYMLHLRKQSS